MERLWSPWRMAYIEDSQDGGKDEGCIFCGHLADGDEVLYLGGHVFVILNAFPYNSGHVMVAPRRHVGVVSALGFDERAELLDVTFKSVDVLGEALGPHGFNVGMNLGRVAGAGIPGHLHMHVVPRWGGDTNFMAVVGDTKVLPEMLQATRAKLKPHFENL